MGEAQSQLATPNGLDSDWYEQICDNPTGYHPQMVYLENNASDHVGRMNMVSSPIIGICVSNKLVHQNEGKLRSSRRRPGLTSRRVVFVAQVTLVFDYPSISAMTELILEGD